MVITRLGTVHDPDTAAVRTANYIRHFLVHTVLMSSVLLLITDDVPVLLHTPHWQSDFTFSLPPVLTAKVVMAYLVFNLLVSMVKVVRKQLLHFHVKICQRGPQQKFKAFIKSHLWVIITGSIKTTLKFIFKFA
jgi:hypothetical protein